MSCRRWALTAEVHNPLTVRATKANGLLDQRSSMMRGSGEMLIIHGHPVLNQQQLASAGTGGEGLYNHGARIASFLLGTTASRI